MIAPSAAALAASAAATGPVSPSSQAIRAAS